MRELVMKIPADDVFPFLACALAMLCGTTVLLTLILSIAWSRFSQRQLATPLIQEEQTIQVNLPTDRGMNADEIETIFAAAWTGKSRRLSRWFRSALRSLPARATA